MSLIINPDRLVATRRCGMQRQRCDRRATVSALTMSKRLAHPGHDLRSAQKAKHDQEVERCAKACKVQFRQNDVVRATAGVAFGAGLPRLGSPTIPSGALAELERRIAELEAEVAKQGVDVETSLQR